MIIKSLKSQVGEKVRIYKYGLGKDGNIYVEEGDYILKLREVRHCYDGVSYDKLTFSIDGRFPIKISDTGFEAGFVEDGIIGGFVSDPKNWYVPKFYSLYNDEKNLNYYKNKIIDRLESNLNFYKEQLERVKHGYSSTYTLETLPIYIRGCEINLKKIRGEN